MDIVLEDRSGNIVGVEVKSSATLKAGLPRGLKDLAEASGKQFVHGIILYLGEKIVPLVHNIHSVPLHLLWNW